MLQSITSSKGTYNERVINILARTVADNKDYLGLILQALVAPLRWLMVPAGIKLWRKISIIEKLLVILLPTVNVLFWLSVGTNKGLFDNLLIFLISLVIFRYVLVDHIRTRFTRRRILIIAAV